MHGAPVAEVETRWKATPDRDPSDHTRSPCALRPSHGELVPKPALDERSQRAAQLSRPLLCGDHQLIREVHGGLHDAHITKKLGTQVRARHSRCIRANAPARPFPCALTDTSAQALQDTRRQSPRRRLGRRLPGTVPPFLCRSAPGPAAPHPAAAHPRMREGDSSMGGDDEARFPGPGGPDGGGGACARRVWRSRPRQDHQGRDRRVQQGPHAAVLAGAWPISTPNRAGSRSICRSSTGTRWNLAQHVVRPRRLKNLEVADINAVPS